MSSVRSIHTPLVSLQLNQTCWESVSTYMITDVGVSSIWQVLLHHRELVLHCCFQKHFLIHSFGLSRNNNKHDHTHHIVITKCRLLKERATESMCMRARGKRARQKKWFLQWSLAQAPCIQASSFPSSSSSVSWCWRGHPLSPASVCLLCQPGEKTWWLVWTQCALCFFDRLQNTFTGTYFYVNLWRYKVCRHISKQMVILHWGQWRTLPPAHGYSVQEETALCGIFCHHAFLD